MRRALLLLPLLLSLSACVHAQQQKLGGTGGAGGTQGFQSTMAPPAVQINTGASCPAGVCTSGQLNQPYSLSLPIQNGVQPYASCTLSSGTLPNGTSLTLVGNACQISGTISPNAGQFTFNIQATDAGVHTALSGNLIVNISCQPVSLSLASPLPPAQQGVAYSLTFPVLGGISPFTFSTTGTLPFGETLSSSGVLSGTPTQAGISNFPITVSDSCNVGAQTDTVNYSETVNTNISVTTTRLSAGVVGQPYGSGLAVSGGTPPYAWTVNSGVLPAGINLNASTGALSGTPTTPGVSSLVFKVTDSLSNSALSPSLSLAIACGPLAIATQSPLPSCTSGQPYNFSMTANPSGFGGLTWSAPGLPSIGLNIAPTTGVISGTCTTVGTLNATINVTDSCPAPQTQSGVFAIAVNPQIPTLGFSTTSPLQTPTTGVPFTQQLTGIGGVPPYTFQQIGGTFPTGISLSANTGVIQGTATQAVTTSPVLQVTDSRPVTFSTTFSMTSVCPAIAIGTTSLNPGTQGVAYSQQINASGGYNGLTYAASGLPTGLTINSTGLISGTPSVNGTFSVSVTAGDHCSPAPGSLTKTYSLSIGVNLAITTPSLPNGTVGQAYSATPSASGGTQPYQWSVQGISTVTGTVHNVTSAPCNAVGDGTTDDTAAINTCIGLLAAGDSIFFPTHTYKVAGTLNAIAVANVTVDLNGSTIHCSGAARYCLTIGSGSLSSSTLLTANQNTGDQTFQANLASLGIVTGDYVALEEGGADVARGIVDPTLCSTAVQCRTDVLHLSNVSGTTATLETATQSVPGLHFPFATVNAAKVFKILSPTQGIRVQNGTIDGTSSTGAGGMIIKAAMNSTFTNVTVQHFAEEGIALWWSYNPSFTTITISDAGDAGGNGAFESQITNHLQINGMTFTSMRAQSWPMFVGEGADNFVSNVNVNGGNVVNSRLFNVGATAYNTFNNINVHDSDPNSIDNGISIQYYAQHLVFNNCTVTNIGVTNASGSAIIGFGNDNSFNTFNNCNVSNSKGFLLANGDLNDSNWTVVGGTFSNAVSTSNDVVRLTGNASHFVSGNTIAGPGANGINLNNSTSSCVNNNVLTASSGLLAGINANISSVVGSGNTLNGFSSNLTAGACTGTDNLGFSSGFTGLPPGLTLNSSTGQISGTPTTAGTYTFQLIVTDANSQTASQQYTVTITPAGAASCGATSGGASATNNKACGNYAGAPYEDLSTASPNTAPNPTGGGALHLISACATIAPAVGDVWRFSTDINDGAGGTNQNCIRINSNAGQFVIDLAGHTLTGGMFANFGTNGITVVNGNITCNLANGGIMGCINFQGGGNPSKSVMLSHLTVHNTNSPLNKDAGFSGFEYAVYLEYDGTTTAACTPGAQQKTFNGNCVEVAHSEIINAFGYTGAGYVSWCARCTDLYISGAGGITAEVWNTLTVCGGFVDACQGTVFFNVGPVSAHNNFANFTTYQGTSDSGRAFLFDAAGKAFNQKGGNVFNNYITAFNNRALRTRQENNVQFHDNLVDHVQGSTTIHEGENDDYAEKLNNNLISKNKFVMEGGTAINIRSAYGVVADSNNFVCGTNCSTGTLATTDLGGNYVFNIARASRTAQCVVTLTLSSVPSTTSSLGGLFVNVAGASDPSFNTSATAGNTVTTRSGAVFTYTQAGCSGAGTLTAAGTFWISQFSADAFAGNGSQLYIKNSTIDPLLLMSQPLVACGTASPSCRFTPQNLNGGQTQIKACNNSNGSPVSAVGGTGALVQNLTGTCP